MLPRISAEVLVPCTRGQPGEAALQMRVQAGSPTPAASSALHRAAPISAGHLKAMSPVLVLSSMLSSSMAVL